MIMSQLFSQTLREAPAEAEIQSHQLLLRAGYIRQLAAGIFTSLPLAVRVQAKIEAILRQEMEAIGGQEVSMPVIHPANLWKETGRWYKIDAEMGRFKDRYGRDLVLAMTHEEVVSDLVRKEIRSYRQMPQLIYHIQTKFRDDPRPRAGLIRTREFTMKDSYSLDTDWEGLDQQYRAHYQAYFNIFHRCGLDVIAVGSDTGMMGGALAHEYMYLTPYGEDTLIICDVCGYAANRQVARFKKEPWQTEALQPLNRVATPECKSIEALANFLHIPQEKTAKAVFLMAEIPATGEKGSRDQEKFIFAVVRGDMEVNETKLGNAVKARTLRPATEEEIRAVGAEPGYASPVGLDGSTSDRSFLVVIDDLIPQSTNLVAGANQAGYHLLNVNYGRDYQADIITDITAAGEGSACPNCSHGLRTVRGVEVGNIFKLGTFYSEAMDCKFLDKDGKMKPVVMGSYGIGLGRLIGCIAEEYHDEHGLTWPVTVAPYQVHLVLLVGKSQEGDQKTADPAKVAEALYSSMQEAGIEVLFDDRAESPGVKFNDADLIGIPIRLTVGERALRQGGIELKRRDQADRRQVPVEEAVAQVLQEIDALKKEIHRKAIKVEYQG
jgi:prolyl-tRNA synthetase